MVSWPWKRRVEVITREQAGDDATAALAMILRYHRRTVTIDEVRQAIFRGEHRPSNALDLVQAAENYRLRGQGVRIDHPSFLQRITLPCIAHMSFGRASLEQPIDGHFAVIDRVTPSGAHLIDPYRGPSDDAYADLVDMWTGVVLVFEEASAAPRAVLR